MQLVLAGNDTQGLRYGTIQMPEKYYLSWKDDEDVAPDPASDVGVGYEMDRDLIRMCSKDRLRDNFGTIKNLLSVLGFPILDLLKTTGRRRILDCEGRGGKATGEYTEDGLVVFKGSTTSPDVAPSAQDTVAKRRQRLVEDEVPQPNGEDGGLIFTEDHAFNSPSGAAVIVLGMHVNGWKAWEDKEGRTLDELERT